MSIARRATILTALALLLAGVACGTSSPSRAVGDGATSTTTTIDPTDRAAVLAAAAHEITTVDNGFGRGGDPFSGIDVVERFGSEAMPLRQELEGELLSDADRAAITAAFAPRPITWVPFQFDPASRPDVPGTRTTPTLPRAAVLLAVPRLDGDSATASVSMRCGWLCGTSGAYALRKVDGTWTITGKAGPWGIS